MFEIDLKSIITMLVDHSLDRYSMPPTWNNGEITREGICMEICLDAYDYKNKKEIKTIIYLMFCGNVSVFYAEAYDNEGNYIHSPIDVPVENWNNTSNHDTCWRSDGLSFIDDIYFDFCKKINPDIAPKNVYTRASFSACSWPVKQVFITYRQNTENNYFKDIVRVEMVK